MRGHNRPRRAFEPAHRCIAVDADDQLVTFAACVVKQCDVSNVQQVEAAVGENRALSLPSPLFHAGAKPLQRHSFKFRSDVESFHGRLGDECLNASWFRTLNDVRRTLDNYWQEYNCDRPHSSLAYRTPAEFRIVLGYGDVESKERFPHLHRPDYDGGEIYSPTDLNRETPVIAGEERGRSLRLDDSVDRQIMWDELESEQFLTHEEAHIRYEARRLALAQRGLKNVPNMPLIGSLFLLACPWCSSSSQPRWHRGQLSDGSLDD
jgi:hypothetical protein